LREISEIMDKTKERVRQIEQKAMRKLKHASRKNQLNDVYTSSVIKVIEPNPEGEFYE
jgi:DNA-directed RNA polymerase sigma subunit (sigma70/sigma32)